MSPPLLALGCIALPVLASVLIVTTGRTPNLREAVTLAAGALVIGCVLGLYPEVSQGARPDVVLAPLVPGVALRLVVEPLGLLFAMVAGFLWPVTTIYAIGYMRAHHERNQTRFYACFAVSIAAAMGVAFAGNLVTLFVFYEVLTLSTYPLVTHAGTPEARRAGRGVSGHPAGDLDRVPAPRDRVDLRLCRHRGLPRGRHPRRANARGRRRRGVLPVRVRRRQGGADAVPSLASGRDGWPRLR